jgi:hypothetical protein
MELLEAMFSLRSEPKSCTEDNPEVGSPKNNCVGEGQQKFARQLEGLITEPFPSNDHLRSTSEI